MIHRDDFEGGEVDLGRVLTRMRHAVSHPTCLHLDDPCPSTGYTSRAENERIRSFVFVHSPEPKTKPKGATARKVFMIEIPAEGMLPLVVSLSNYLAQPVLREKWNGITINPIIAA